MLAVADKTKLLTMAADMRKRSATLFNSGRADDDELGHYLAKHAITLEHVAEGWSNGAAIKAPDQTAKFVDAK